MTPEEKEFLLNCEFGIAVEVDGNLEEVVLFQNIPTEVDYKDILLEASIEYSGEIKLREAADFEVNVIKKEIDGEAED